MTGGSLVAALIVIYFGLSYVLLVLDFREEAERGEESGEEASRLSDSRSDAQA